MTEYRDMTDSKLEEAWYCCSDKIGAQMQIYFNTNDDYFRNVAIEEQGKQVLIQQERARREK